MRESSRLARKTQLGSGALFGNDATLSATSKIKEREKSSSLQKSSLPDCHENDSHRGAGLPFGSDATISAASKIKERKKSSLIKKGASRLARITQLGSGVTGRPEWY